MNPPNMAAPSPELLTGIVTEQHAEDERHEEREDHEEEEVAGHLRPSAM